MSKKLFHQYTRHTTPIFSEEDIQKLVEYFKILNQIDLDIKNKEISEET
jgi:hypothetical protein